MNEIYLKTRVLSQMRGCSCLHLRQSWVCSMPCFEQRVTTHQNVYLRSMSLTHASVHRRGGGYTHTRQQIRSYYIRIITKVMKQQSITTCRPIPTCIICSRGYAYKDSHQTTALLVVTASTHRTCHHIQAACTGTGLCLM